MSACSQRITYSFLSILLLNSLTTAMQYLQFRVILVYNPINPLAPLLLLKHANFFPFYVAIFTGGYLFSRFFGLDYMGI